MDNSENYLKDNSKINLNCQDYSLSNNNLSIEELNGIISIKDLKKFCKLITNYPDFEYKNLRKNIKKYYGVEKIVLGCGSEELIVRINRFLNRQRENGICYPNFYRIAETLPKHTELNLNYSSESPYYEIENISKIKKLKTIWLSNPNPIIGKICRKEYLKKIIIKNPNTLFIIDESAIDLIENPNKYSFLKDAEKINNLIVIRSFSKLFGLAGLRLGFACGRNKLINQIEKDGATFPINNLGDYLVCKILINKNFTNNIQSKIHKNKKIIEDYIKKEIGLNLSTSVTNCIYIDSYDKKIYNRLTNIGIKSLRLNNQKGVKNLNMLRITIHSSDELFKDLKTKIKKLKPKRGE